MTQPVALTQGLVQNTGLFARTAVAKFTAADVSDWTRFENSQVTVQVDGSATSVTFKVERTTLDPSTNTVTAAPADTTATTGNPSSGMSPNVYAETGVGWWRVNVSAVSGGTAVLSISGLGS